MKLVTILAILCATTGCSSLGWRSAQQDLGPMVDPGPYPGVRTTLEAQSKLAGAPSYYAAFAPIIVIDMIGSLMLDTALLPIDIWSSGRTIETQHVNSGHADILDIFTRRYNQAGELDGMTVLLHNLKPTAEGERAAVIQYINYKDGKPVGECHSANAYYSGTPKEIARGTYQDGRKYSGTFFVRDKSAKTGGYIVHYRNGKQVAKKAFQH